MPPRLAATLFWGLRDDARVKLKLAGAPISTDRLLSAIMADRLGLLVWSKTKDARKGSNRPTSIADQLLQTGRKSTVQAFGSGADFEAARRRILKEVEPHA